MKPLVACRPPGRLNLTTDVLPAARYRVSNALASTWTLVEPSPLPYTTPGTMPERRSRLLALPCASRASRVSSRSIGGGDPRAWRCGPLCRRRAAPDDSYALGAAASYPGTPSVGKPGGRRLSQREPAETGRTG